MIPAPMPDAVGIAQGGLEGLIRHIGSPPHSRPCLATGAAEALADEIALERLFPLIGLLDASRVRFYRDGAEIEGLSDADADRFGAWGRRLNSARLLDEIQRGGTLVMIEIQDSLPEAQPLISRLQALSGERVWANIFANYAAGAGIAPHWDDNNVLVIQLEGARRWLISAPQERFPVAGMSQPERQEAADEVVLSTSDVLFIPWGWVHRTEPLTERSVHLMLAYRDRTGLDFLSWLFTRLVADERVRAPLSGAPHDAAARLAEAVAEKLDEGAIVEFLRTRASNRPDLAFSKLLDALYQRDT